MNRGTHLKRMVPPLLGAATLITLPALGTVPATAATQAAGTVPYAQSPETKLSDQLIGRLGSQQAGSYLDGAGKLVVNVTNASAAQQVRTAGAKARIVKHGMQPLNDSKSRLDRLAGTKGTTGLSWGVDVVSNAVVVYVPKNDKDAATKSFIKRARAISGVVKIEKVAGPAHVTLGPGDAIMTGGSRCSVSAFGVSGSTTYLVTAGHCTNAGSTWTAGGQTVGTRQLSSFPNNDYGTIRVTNTSMTTTNDQLTEVGKPPVGTQVQKKGSTTGTTSGSIKAYDRTVNYSEGAVTGLIATNACAQPGDSGGSLQSGNIAVGITSGISGSSCSGSGFESFFQPLDEAMQAGNLTLKK
ncbi:alpha-lytic protease prodomain-containing protein [Actinomadura graeca]|uniref:Alpha-lytic protease prodomain-containing protein n=1 Tax=Actinomadura graeca TaxID=2750812 RepID=A0ABX8QYG8_9ACTN|nr:S1 family peptidase [Actinomadura graeca]QXJ23224.1 alpha-lytic protease prodomain-containing protein [Actinomadura graeca]